jgi:hypothetical protein
MMDAVVIYPGEGARVITIPAARQAMQIVGGCVANKYDVIPGVDAYYSEEDDLGHGPIVFVAHSGAVAQSLTQAQAAEIMARFGRPEQVAQWLSEQ